MGKASIYKYTLPSSHSSWTMLASNQGICRLLFPQDTTRQVHHWLLRYAPDYELLEERAIFEEFGALPLLERYLAGQRVSFDAVPMDLWGTAFQREVWAALGEIPYGEVQTYKQLAKRIGRPNAARAVGAAGGQNPLPVFLPCHRVIGTNGTLTGYRGGLRIKNELLKLEGVIDVKEAGHERFNF